jgi:MFS family permease
MSISEHGSSTGLEQTRSAAGDRNPWLIAVVVSIATFMQVLDTSIANVALRHIAGSLAAGIDESAWIITTYLVASAVIVPISAWLMSVIGRKRFYMLCVALFTGSSLLCGLAPSLGMLIFFRVLQGLGGGGMVPSEQAILADTFPPERRAQAFAVYGIAVVVAPTIGPTLGGWITDNWSWEWIFFINVPIGIVSLVLVQWLLVEPEALKRERRELLASGLHIDWGGIILVGVWLGCLEIVLDKGQREDWFQSNFINGFATASAIAFVLFVPWGAHPPRPDRRSDPDGKTPVRRFFHHDDDGGGNHVQLDAAPAATAARKLRLYRHAVGPRLNAWGSDDASDDADRGTGDQSGAAQISHGVRNADLGTRDVAPHVAAAGRKLRIFLLGARVSDDRHAVPVRSDHDHIV